MSIIQTIPSASFAGAPKVVSPVPILEGRLIAAHLLGSVWDGSGAAGDDYGGLGHDLILGSATVASKSVSSGATAYATTSITTGQLLGDGSACTVIVVANVPTNASITPLAQSSEGDTANYLALHAAPSGNYVRAFTVQAATAQNVTHNYSTVAIEGAPAFYFARWDGTDLNVGIIPASGVLESTSGTTTTSPEGSGRFALGKVAAPNSDFHALAFYCGYLDDSEVLEVYAALRARLATQAVLI